MSSNDDDTGGERLRQANSKALRIAVFDNGWMRSLSQLIIVSELMNRIKHDDNLQDVPKPSEYFDMMGGSGTGGLIAIMLGRLRLSVKDALKAYCDLAEEVFTDKKPKWKGETFSAVALEVAMKKVITSSLGNPDERMLDQSEDHCKTIVCAIPAANTASPRIFRSYQVRQNSTFDCYIWEAVRATMATPKIFKRILVGEEGLKEAFIGADLGCNNPTKYVLEEVQLAFGSDRRVGCIVSLGTGQQSAIALKPSDILRRLLSDDVLRLFKGIVADCEKIAEEVDTLCSSTTNFYFRFSVSKGLQDIPLAEWTKGAEVKTHTMHYLRQNGVNKQIETLLPLLRGASTGETSVLAADLVRIQGRATSSVLPLSGLNSPPPPSKLFTGRQNLLLQLDTFFRAHTPQDPEQKVSVIHGIGGGGKTQLALMFAERSKNLFRYRFIIDGSSVDSITIGLKSIGRELGYEQWSWQDVLNWFKQCRDRWMILYDNFDNPSINICDYFPRCSHGSIIVTSRNWQCSLLAPTSSHEIGTMEEAEAVELMMRSTSRVDDQGDAKVLVEQMGYLALAIVQAAGYISQHRINFVEYLEMYQQSRKDLLEHNIIQNADRYRNSVYTTWEISFQALQPLSRTLIEICAYLHHANIPEELFRRATMGTKEEDRYSDDEDEEYDDENIHAKARVRDFLNTFLNNDGCWNRFTLFGLIAELRSYSLIQHHSSSHGLTYYNIHPLVHSYAKDRLLQATARFNRLCALHLLTAAISTGGSMKAVSFRLGILAHVQQSFNDVTHSTNILNRYAAVYRQHGLWAKEHELRRQVLDNRSRTLGDVDKRTLRAMSAFAGAYYTLGNAKDAEALLVKALDAKERTLGGEHPETLDSMSDLALMFYELGKFEDAVALGVKTLKVMARVMGDEHPERLTAMGNLALTYTRQGKLKDAEELGVKVVEAIKRTLGDEHPHTMSAMANLAATYRFQGKSEDAEALEEKVLEARKRILGEEHSDTLLTMNNLAVTLLTMQRWEEAEKLMGPALEGHEKVRGAKHPLTLRSVKWLIDIYDNLGKVDDAASLRERRDLASQSTS